MTQILQKRLLIVDDNKDIHQDFYRIFKLEIDDAAMAEDEAILFNIKSKANSAIAKESYAIDSAYQGQEAVEMVQRAKTLNQPYALAFVDIRMPPGMDGIETIKQIWQIDPNIQTVICSAHSDHSWEDITQQLGISDSLLILKKPFEPIEIRQLASALTKKWELVANLHAIVKERTASLEKSISLIKATLESIQEGIIVLNQNKKVVTYNKNFQIIWNTPTDFIHFENSDFMFQQIADQLEEPAMFLTSIENIFKDSESINIRDWKLKSGKVVELYTHPQYLHNNVVGMVFSFRDVSEQKKLEEKLLQQVSSNIK